MNPPKVVSHEDWLKARRAHLAAEKELTRARDAVAEARRALPWEKIEKTYVFDTRDGKRALSELFGSKSQLILVHFMFGPDWEQGCPSCSFMADTYNPNVIHLAHRDVGLVAVSRTALGKIEAYKKRMGWTFPWVSSLGSDFNFDFDVSFDKETAERGEARYNYAPLKGFIGEEMPGLSIFAKDDAGQVYHTYSTFSRGVEVAIAAYPLLDLVPKGRGESGPKNSHKMTWVRRHDQYED
jgi:predicted dithiol-disulfide oxidoreductase (DUF899 family)